MAIRDVLWLCPGCQASASIRPGRRGVERCTACGASFRRGRGAEIVASFPDGRSETRPAPAWMATLRELPPAPGTRAPDGPLANASVAIREVCGYDPVRSGAGELLNRIERLSTVSDGMLELYDDRLTLHLKGSTRVWPLLEISALGSSSGSLQLRRRGEILMVRFHDASVRWWEERLRAALRDAWRAAGRGEILEFQPRVVAR